MTKQYVRFVTNYRGKPEKKKKDGKEHFVLHATMLMEGVFEGSAGKVFYPRDWIKKSVKHWNHKPAVLNHPIMNGAPVSAGDVKVLEEYQLGILLNTQYDEETTHLDVEIWVDVEKVRNKNSQLHDAMVRGDPIEVSTGLEIEPEFVTNEDYNGSPYDIRATNFVPDHLAILTDSVGACSLKHGCGCNKKVQNSGSKEMMPLNEMSSSRVRQELYKSIGPMFYVEDIYSDFFIYSDVNGKLFKKGYKQKDEEVTLTKGDPVEVKRYFEYRTMDNKFVGNKDFTEKESNMDKAAKVNKLIENRKDWEKEKDWLLKQSDEVLDKLLANSGKAPEPTPAPTPTPTPAPTTAPAPTNTPPAPVSMEVQMQQYLQNAPGAIRDFLVNGISSWCRERDTMIAAIVSNKSNVFTPEQLAQMPADVLRNIYAIAKQPAPTPEPQQIGTQNSYIGAWFNPPGVNPAVLNAGGGNDNDGYDPVPLPTLNFSKKN